MFMNKIKFHALFLMTWIIFLGSIPLHGQFVTIARKIKSMHTEKTDIATVLIDAKPQKVYKAIIDTLTTDTRVKIKTRDNSIRQVEFNNGRYDVSMRVDSLAAVLTQITVAVENSGESQKPATNPSVEAILKVCQKAGITCTVEQ